MPSMMYSFVLGSMISILYMYRDNEINSYCKDFIINIDHSEEILITGLFSTVITMCFYDEKIRNFLFITAFNCFVLQFIHNHKDEIITNFTN